MEDKERVLVILGSARNESNTLKAVQQLCPYPNYEIIDLNQFEIRPYHYEQSLNRGDGFYGIAEKMLEADVIVFATPVYWYSMSGQMKIFFDRMTDLTGIYKSMGKSLRGKQTYLIVSGGEPQMPEGFEIPFRRTSNYFNMVFQGSFYRKN